jgi:hypothetical protein
MTVQAFYSVADRKTIPFGFFGLFGFFGFSVY